MREIGVGFSGDGFLENAGEVEAAYGKIKVHMLATSSLLLDLCPWQPLGLSALSSVLKL
jgi:hypothetical protein